MTGRISVSLSQVPEQGGVTFLCAEHDEPESPFVSVAYRRVGHREDDLTPVRIDLDRRAVMDLLEDREVRHAFDKALYDIWIAVMESRSKDEDWRGIAGYLQEAGSRDSFWHEEADRRISVAAERAR